MSKLSSIFGGKKDPKPLPPLPTKDDPEIAAARKRAATAEKLRRGRSQSVLTSGSGVTGDENITRPGARKATLLGE